MKLFLDTANVEQIKEAASLGVLSGITTNPPIIAREGGYDVKSQIAKVLPLIDGEVIAQVVSLNAEGMIRGTFYGSFSSDLSGWSATS